MGSSSSLSAERPWPPQPRSGLRVRGGHRVSLWYGKTDAEWREIWRQERLREDDALAYYDEVGGQITGKALAQKFDLGVGRVNRLLRRRREGRERALLFDKIERFEQERASNAFASVAERLWMDLGWLATELEKRRCGHVSTPTR